MSQVLFGVTLSLDGFVNDRNGNFDMLYPDLANMRYTPFLQESIARTGAVVMGRRAYDVAQGDLTGYEYQCPIFVVTHHPPAQPPQGQNDKLTVTFVTEGVQAAIERAKSAAGAKDVTVIGTPNIGKQLVEADLIDEFELGIVPFTLGGGLRFFDHVSLEPERLERIKVTESPSRTDIRYRVVRLQDIKS